ncbi:small multidrug efflux protein [Salana multivorans]
MNLIETFQNLVTQVPELVQPIIIALAGAVPFIEGEGAVSIGIVGGVNPIIAAVSATLGSFACVFVVVQVSARARQAIVERRSRSLVAVGGGSTEIVEAEVAPESGRRVARREKFQRAFDRYGVPGVSLLGPLVLPPAFTAPMLIAVGVDKTRVLFWQAIGIILWVVLFTIIFTTLISTVG